MATIKVFRVKERNPPPTITFVIVPLNRLFILDFPQNDRIHHYKENSFTLQQRTTIAVATSFTMRPHLKIALRAVFCYSDAMEIIHKIAAVVIQNNKFLMVRKKGKDIWTNLGGHPEEGETEQQALLREIKEEMGCDGEIEKKLGDFEAPAAHDNAVVKLSTYLVKLQGPIIFEDPELEEYKFIDKNYEQEGIKLPASITEKVLPYCISEKLLDW